MYLCIRQNRYYMNTFNFFGFDFLCLNEGRSLDILVYQVCSCCLFWRMEGLCRPSFQLNKI